MANLNFDRQLNAEIYRHCKENKILNFTTKKGRDACFKCIYCGKFVSYDRRKTNVNCITEGHFDAGQEQWYPEEVVEMSHKHCATLAKNKND